MANHHLNNRKSVISEDLALACDLFDKFCSATTLKLILSNYRKLCVILNIKPTNFPQFYPKLKSKLNSWRAQAIWNKFDKRANHKCYNRGKACPNTRVLIIGAGPCGLRTAIEAQLLGAKVVVIEKRDRITRNNVLHLWPFVIHDLRSLGAKKFFGKFCAGSIDHISIRQLQCILLKVALLLGVEIHEGVSFESLVPPSESVEERVGWRAKIDPAESPVAQYEFDVLIGADGKRNTLEGFKRKEFRGKLAIAITANFIHYHTEAEARVEEISGVAYIFNQKFFNDLKQTTEIDLENIVYYKDDTHYFVMTAKKQSLINKNVIINDYPDTAKLLAIENLNKEALMEYAREAANFSTGYKLPHLNFAVNHHGQPDITMFDFTSMYAAENASRVIQEKGYKLLMCLVGDSLLEPFWPTGSGCARGFLSSMDAAWAIRSWSVGYMNTLEILSERESIYRLLNQTTPENLSRDFSNYTLDPHSRYQNLNTKLVLPIQVKRFYMSDDPTAIEFCLKTPSVGSDHLNKKRKRKDTQIHQDVLLSWLKRQVALYSKIHITDTCMSFKDGLALCAIIHRYRPDLIDFDSLDPSDLAGNNQLAFDILEKEYRILPVMSGAEMKNCDAPDSLAMVSYLTQVYDIFRGEIPYMHNGNNEEDGPLNETCPSAHYKTSLNKMSQAQKISLLSRITSSLPRKRNRESKSPASLSRNADLPEPRKSKKRRSRSSTAAMEQRTKHFERTKREPIENLEDRHHQKVMTARIMNSVRMLQENKNKKTDEECEDSKIGGASYYNNPNFFYKSYNYSAENDPNNHEKSLAARIMKSVRMLQENNRNDFENSEPFEDYSMFLYRQVAPDFKERVKDLEKKLLHRDRENMELHEFKRNPMEGNFSGRVKDIETKLKEGNKLEKKPKDLNRAIGKIEKTDWNVREIEKKIQENIHGRGGYSEVAKVPKWSRQQFDDKIIAVKKKLIDKEKKSPDSKYSSVDEKLKLLDEKLKNGTVLSQGLRGANKVSEMAAQLTTLNQQSKETPLLKSNSKNVIIPTSKSASEICNFCNKRVYLMERLVAEGRYFHKGCFRCEYCGTLLRLGNHTFDRDGKYGSRFYCAQHVGYPGVFKKKQQKNKFNDKYSTHDDNDDNGHANYPETPSSKNTSKDSIDTPERIGFENLEGNIEDTGNISFNEMDEDAWTDHNFGASANELASSNDVSEISESDEDDNEEEFAQALDIPSIDNNESLEFTRRFPHEPIPSVTLSKHRTVPRSSQTKVNDDDSCSSFSGNEPNISYHAFESEESNTATGGKSCTNKKVSAKQPKKSIIGIDSGSETEVKYLMAKNKKDSVVPSIAIPSSSKPPTDAAATGHSSKLFSLRDKYRRRKTGCFVM